MTKIERCFQCDEPTGRAGITEDSLYAVEDSRDAKMYNNSGMWVRLPSEDKEIEVPE